MRNLLNIIWVLLKIAEEVAVAVKRKRVEMRLHQQGLQRAFANCTLFPHYLQGVLIRCQTSHDTSLHTKI